MRSTLRPTGTPYRISVATASAVFRVRLTRTISRALPRTAAAMAEAQPTLPVPTIPIFIDPSLSTVIARLPSWLAASPEHQAPRRRTPLHRDRKSTRLNSSHGYISYAVFCLKKKKLHEAQILVCAIQLYNE